MTLLSGKTILLVIPKSQFDEEELFPVRDFFQEAGARVLILSKSGQECRGMQKARFQPDGVIVDWNKQEGFVGKYSAVLVMGGRGASKSLWDDPILPQILTDHRRAGKVIGAVGTAVAVLARGSLLDGGFAAPDDDKVNAALEECSLFASDEEIVKAGNVVTAKNAQFINEFSEMVKQALLENE